MNIVICGAGEVGRHAAEVLGANGNNITVLDQDPDRLDKLRDVLDVRFLRGNGTHGDVLLEAGCNMSDLFIATTNQDEINLLAASIAKGMGAGKTVARVHHRAFFERRGLEYDRYLGIDHLVCPEYSTALAIAQNLRSPGAMAVERFARGRIEMQTLPVSDKAMAVGKSLTDLALPGATRVAAIERDQKPFIPSSQTWIREGDVVTLVGQTETFAKARRMFHNEKSGRYRVMIIGGSPLGVWLCRALENPDFAVRLFEPNKQRAKEISEKLDWATILTNDPAEADTLKEERVDQADAFVAVTDDDEHNILAAARAKSMGAKVAMAVLHRPTYLHLLKDVGIDAAFSPRINAVAEIRHLVNESPLRVLASLAVGIADVYEVRIPTEAKRVIGRPLSVVGLPEKTIVVAIQRKDQVHFPAAADSIAAGDTVVLIAPTNSRKQLMKTFSIK